MKPISLLVLLLTIFTGSLSAQKYSELAQTPPMGWNSWNKFQADVDENIIRAMAEAMATNGMKSAGYQYINIDDCWQGERDEQGFIQADKKKFPSGIKALADFVHGKGLKLGIYSDVGYKTCGGHVASRGHEFQDARTYALWGVDYLKYDWCNAEGLKAEGAYTTMRDAIRAAGRPMVFSLCEWGNNKPWTWAPNVGHLWRTTTDIYPAFDGVLDHSNWQQWSVLKILDAQKPLRSFAGPGNWNDPDMLEVGNGMSASEDRAHFTMWCMLAAPLISGNDLAHMNPTVLATLTNPDVIAIDQDPLGVEAFPYSTNSNIEIWFRPLANGDWAMCALNRSQAAQHLSWDWKMETVFDSFSKRDAKLSETVYELKNLWTGETGDTSKILATDIPGHDVLMLRLKKTMAVEKKVVRIKMGVTAAFTDEVGNVWEADHGFADGETIEREADMPIANTKTPSLYRSERYGMTAFSLPLPNGKYTVKLHFAETYTDLSTAGSRVFSFNVGGKSFPDLDIFAKTGGVGRAYVETVPIDITNGKLDITFTANVENPEINAIEIIPAS